MKVEPPRGDGPARGLEGSAGTSFVVADSHVVYLDAVRTSPWTKGEGGGLPGRGDWSTFRFAVKDVILGVATLRINRQTRRLEVRAWFVGEHPAFRALEPTRALLVVIMSQAWQQLGRLAVFFEPGLPYDVRAVAESLCGARLSGHEQALPEDIALRLYVALSGLPDAVQRRVADQVPVERVCYAIYRDIWSASQIRHLALRGVPLAWIFLLRPDPLYEPLQHAHLLLHLRAVLLEEYVLNRLAARRLGDGAGRRIAPVGAEADCCYASEVHLKVPEFGEGAPREDDSFLELPAGAPFRLLAVLVHSASSIPSWIRARLRDRVAVPGVHEVIAVPLEFNFLQEQTRRRCAGEIRTAGASLIVAGVSTVQLLAEAEMKLAVTGAVLSDDELVDWNENRYSD